MFLMYLSLSILFLYKTKNIGSSPSKDKKLRKTLMYKKGEKIELSTSKMSRKSDISDYSYLDASK